MKTRFLSFKIIMFAMLLCTWLVTSCSYDDYADADYPASEVYQSQADGVLRIDATTAVSTAEVTTKGTPLLYEIDKEGQKLIVHLGVVQSGIKLSSGTVRLAADESAVATRQTDGTVAADFVTLAANDISLPDEVRVTGDNVPFDVEISLAALSDSRYAGKQVAFAVTIASTDIKENEDLATQIVVIDTDFVKSQLQ